MKLNEKLNFWLSKLDNILPWWLFKLKQTVFPVLNALWWAFAITLTAAAIKGEAFVYDEDGSNDFLYCFPFCGLSDNLIAWWKTIFPFLLLLVLYLWAKFRKNNFISRIPIRDLVFLLGLAICSSILFDAIKGDIKDEDGKFLLWMNSCNKIISDAVDVPYLKWFVLLSFFIFLLLCCLSIFKRDVIVQLQPQDKAKPHKVLILPVSPNQEGYIKDRNDVSPEIQAILANKLGFKLSEDNKQLITPGKIISINHPFPDNADQAKSNIKIIAANENKPTFWKNMMALRAIYPHLANDCLQQIILIGSPEDKGSSKDLNDIEKMIKMVCGNKLKIEKITDINFDNFDQLMKITNKIIEKCQRGDYGGKYRGRDDIMIDVTAGFKVASIVAAISTLNNDVSFQYVHTNTSIADNNEIMFQVLYEESKL